MSDQLQLISARIKDLREITGISPELISGKLGIDVATYLEFESGNSDIPVGVLFNIANVFNVKLTELLTGDLPKLHTYCVVRKDKGVSVERRKHYKYQSLADNFINKKSEPFMVTVEAEPENTPINYSSHPGQEFNYVLEGSLKVFINGYEIDLNEGDSLYFDSGISHGMKALGGKAAKFLAIIL